MEKSHVQVIGGLATRVVESFLLKRRREHERRERKFSERKILLKMKFGF